MSWHQPTTPGRASTGRTCLQYLSDVVQSGNYPLLAGALTGQHEPKRPEEVFNSVITNYLAGAGLQVAASPA
ncbi:hypothetical protein [Arthrobacter flavus]|uniref:Uncharacterized protein n=1 Tax=Arthrobacter flavus TaxID=95172 RepID=A0ABW4QC59_9MICC